MPVQLRIRERQRPGLPAGVLVYADQGRHAQAGFILQAHLLTDAQRRHQQNIEVRPRHDAPVMDVVAMRKDQRTVFFHAAGEDVFIHGGLLGVGYQHHDQLGLRRLFQRYRLQAMLPADLGRSGAGAQTDHHILPGIP